MSAPDRLKKDLATVESIIEYLEKEEKKEKGEDVTKDEVEVVSPEIRSHSDLNRRLMRF